MKTLGALFTLTLFTATACGGLVTTASESIEPEEPHDAWVDANGVEVVGAFGASATDLFYEDADTNIWRLDASTGLVRVTGYMLGTHARYTSSDCSGPSYMVGTFPPPRYTFTAPEMKGEAAKVIRVLKDEQIIENIEACSSAIAPVCSAAPLRCSPVTAGVPEQFTLPTPALTVPVLVLTPPLHFERAVVNVD